MFVRSPAEDLLLDPSRFLLDCFSGA